MRQAIETKYLGPTNHRGSRVSAKAYGGHVVTSWACNLNSEQNHAAGAYELAKKMEWSGVWVAGGNATGTGNVYVWVAKEPGDLFEADQFADLVRFGDAFFVKPVERDKV